MENRTNINPSSTIMQLIINKIIYRNLFNIDLDIQINFLEQLTSFGYDQRNKNLVHICSFLSILMTPVPVIITTYYIINQQSHVCFLLIYILFILNLLTSLTFFAIFCIIPNYLPLKIRISKKIESWKIYVNDWLLSLHLLILCGILILKVLIGKCTSSALLCNPLQDSGGIPFLIIVIILSPIIYSVIFCGIQFITLLSQCLFTLITLFVAGTILGWNAQNIFIVVVYMLLSPMCIFQIHILQIKQFVLYMNLGYKIINNKTYEDLEYPVSIYYI